MARYINLRRNYRKRLKSTKPWKRNMVDESQMPRLGSQDYRAVHPTPARGTTNIVTGAELCNMNTR